MTTLIMNDLIEQYFAQSNDTDVVAVKKLHKIYGSATKCGKENKDMKIAVESVSFGIPKGQVFGLLGKYHIHMFYRLHNMEKML